MTVTFRVDRWALWAVVAGLGAAAAGCNKSEAAPARTDRAQQVQGDGAAPAAKVEADEYIAEIRATGPVTKGKEAKVEVVIRAKTDFHINDQYPHKFVLREAEGAGFAKPVVKRDDGSFNTSTLTLPIVFTPSKEGKLKVGGIAHFSVCSDKNCLMPKPDLELTVDVKP